MSASSPTVTLIYTGPPHQEWHDGQQRIVLVAGRRYQIPAAVAEYWLRRDTGHWKRPELPSAPRAEKE